MNKLYRSSRDRKITGLCGGLSEYLNVDATLLRILLVVVTAFSGGTIIAVYIIAALVVPKEPPYYGDFGPNHHSNNNYVPPYGAGPGPGPGPGPGGYDPYRYKTQHQTNMYQTPPKPDWSEPAYKADPAVDKQFDSMMDDLEKKALKREIEQLKSKIEKYEKGE
ncbi:MULTISPECIES: PspC domain-containing protein [unclassified Paenibacillus]|uniref:PspC domain-containing protein n=1 Tax=unclassified Paenibacillus TaxID=185978 RepID=UPI002F3FB563